MKKIVLLFLAVNCFYLFNLLSAQNAESDSLEGLLRLHPERDTARANLLNDIAWLLYSNNNEKSLKYAAEAEEISDELGYKKGKAESLNIFGAYFYVKSNFPLSLEYFQKSLKLQEQLGNKSGIAACLNNIGAIHTESGNYEDALDNFQRSLKIKKEIGETESIPSGLNNIGNIYIELGNLEKAKYYYERSIKIKLKLGDEKGISASYENIGLLYLDEGRYEDAIDCFQKSLQISSKTGNLFEICGAYLNIANVMIKLKQYSDAFDYATKGLKIAEKNDFVKKEMDIRFILSEIYAHTNDYKKAYENHVLFKELNDSIFNDDNLKEIAALSYQYKYEIEKQENELILQKEKMRSRIRQFIIYFIIFLIFVASGIFYRIKVIKMKLERASFLREIESLKFDTAMLISSSDKSMLKGLIDRQRINDSIQGELNESDWKVLNILCSNPNIKNRSISEQVALSYDGVRSSLRKMYRVFDIPKTHDNQRMELVIQALRSSNAK